MTLKLAQFCDDPKKYPQNLHTPKKYSFFWKPPKILKFRILNPPKKPEPTYVWKYQSTSPLGNQPQAKHSSLSAINVTN